MTDPETLALIKEALVYVAPDKEHAFAQATLDSDLADLGIDSLAAVEIAGYVEDRLGVTLPDDELAQVHSLDGFAALIRNHDSPAPPALR